MSVPIGYTDIIKDVYEGVVTSVRTEERSEFPMTLVLHHGSGLSPYLFTLVLDGLPAHST